MTIARQRAAALIAALTLVACTKPPGAVANAAAPSDMAVDGAALGRELLAMAEVDQQARSAVTHATSSEPGAWDAVRAIDHRNTARMKEIVSAYGWPPKSLVGRLAAERAWLLVQHADDDPAFQERCLPLMEAAVSAGEADVKNYAYLADRVAVAQGRKQLYGTQFTGYQEPKPIEDESHVDERRKAIGLSSMAEYRATLIREYGGTELSPPKR